jgi:hypothetical protein
MAPWIHGLFIMTIDWTDLDQHIPLVLEGLPWISDVAKCQVGTRWCRAAPRWHWAMLACGPRWPCHVHLLPWSISVTILAKIYHIFCIQIILQAQMELVKLKKILHMWWWFTSLYHAFRWNVDGQNCHRTVQIIRAQVQKQSPKWSNSRTWAHIIPVVQWNHEEFQTNQHTSQDRSDST